MEYMEAGLPGGRLGRRRPARAGRRRGVGHPGAARAIAAALAAALGELIGDPAERRRMGERGQRLRRERWSLEAWAGRIEALYLELLSRRRG